MIKALTLFVLLVWMPQWGLSSKLPSICVTPVTTSCTNQWCEVLSKNSKCREKLVGKKPKRAKMC
jgi:hypothetical protein